ncbi:MAG: hypothetical protein SGBAC_007334 [Bacillariaceae sp.]
MSGLAVGGFIAIVFVIAILNVAGVIGYFKFTEKNPEKAPSVKLDSELVSKLRYLLLGLIALSWIFSVACTVACTFVKITQTATVFVGFGSPYNSVQSDAYYLGLRGAQYGGVCTSGDIEEDRVRTAYAFAVINNLLTTAALIGIPLVMFNVIKDSEKASKVWKIMGYLLLASTWCCLFTFYVQQTTLCDANSDVIEFECSLGGAGVAQVFNSMFLIGICVLFFVLPSPVDEDGDGDNAEATEVKDGEEKKEKEEQAPEEEEPTKHKESDEEEEGDFVNVSEED